MSIARIRNAFPCFAHCLVICGALVYGPRPAFSQTPDPSAGQTDEAQPISGKSPSSEQASNDQQQTSTQSIICGLTHLGQCLRDIGHDQAGIWTSPLHIAPGDAIWLLPFAGATGVAIHYDAQAQQKGKADYGSAKKVCRPILTEYPL